MDEGDGAVRVGLDYRGGGRGCGRIGGRGGRVALGSLCSGQVTWCVNERLKI